MHSDRIARSGVALSKIAYNKVDLKHFRKSFYHLAPAGRMIKASVIKKNHIQFPEMILEKIYNFSQKSFSILNVLVQHKMWFIVLTVTTIIFL